MFDADEDIAAKMRAAVGERANEVRPLRLVDPTTLEGVPVPPREWIVLDWLPVGYTTADYGDGGTGKTLLGQQLQTSCATGFTWCGLGVTLCRSLGFYCEDSEDELHRRQDDICRAFGLRFADLGDMRWISGVGEDNTLVRFTPDGEMQVTARYAEIATAAMSFGARLVVLDTAADLFAGNENDRNQVRRFISLLNRLAQKINGAVLLNAHPSRSGLSTGNLDGGSTGWSNSVRSRWSLGRPATDDDAQPDTNERVLTRRKANYASIGDEVKLRWVKGVLVPVTREGGLAGAVHRETAEVVFLDLLDRCGSANFPVSAGKSSTNYAPKMFARRPDAQGFKKPELEAAMHKLLADGKIVLENYGRPGDERRRIVRAGSDASE